MQFQSAMANFPAMPAMAAIVLAAACDPGPARAQSPVDQQLQQLGGPFGGLAERPLSERILIGREDLVVLKDRQFFTLYVNPTYSFTDNANFSRANRVHDSIASMSAGLRFSTQIAEYVDVFAQAGYAGSRYGKSTNLDFDGVQGRFGFSLPKLPGGVNLTASYEPSSIHAKGFGQRKLLQHAINLSLSRDFEVLPGLTITPIAAFSYLPSSPNDYTSTVIRGRINATYLLTPQLAITGAVDFSQRQYSKFFPATYDRKRRDDVWAVNGGLIWAPTRYTSLMLGASYAAGHSSLDPFTYRAAGITPTMQLALRF